MIGFQQQQTRAGQQAVTATAAAGPGPGKSTNASSRASPTRDHLQHHKHKHQHQHQHHQLPQLSQHCQNMSLAGTPPARPYSAASSSRSSPSPTGDTGGHEQVRARQPHKTTSRRVSSPGYHSAASSPGSSSIASPVSSSSSGVSSAASSSCNRTRMLTSPQPPVSAPSTQTIVSCTTASVSHGGGFHTQHAINSPPSSGLTISAPGHSQHPMQRGSALPAGSTQTNPLLEHFTEIGHDGLRLSWFHDANNRQTLDRALAGSRLIIAGDIALAEMSRYPVPIMARAPLGVSDLTLETWLSEVIRSRKAIKLTFTSTRTVEPAFRVLARHAPNIKGPLILSADILTRPSNTGAHARQTSQATAQRQHDQQPVDAWTFLMLCRTRFPRSIISIGWCPVTSAQAQLAGPDSCVQPADSSTAVGADSMFELDMMTMDQHQAPPVVSEQHHFSQPILHLSSAPSSQQHHRLSSLNVVQQLAAVAAAAAANNGAHNNNNNNNNNNHHHNQQQQQQQQHFILSSNGSLNSSSGNSSGSPSPTSPIGQLMRQHSSQLQQQRGHSSRPHAVGGWPAMAAAAMVAANNLRQGCRLGADEEDEHAERNDREQEGHEEEEGEGEEQEEDDDDDDEQEEEEQLPLNLNINEADPQHATPQAAALDDLAQKIHSLQRQSSNLNKLTSSLGKVRSLPLASHGNQTRWEHISKKAALAHRLNADNPSPVSSSPKQQQAQHHHYNSHLLQHQTTGGGNLLCVKSPHPLQQHQQHHQHHQHYHNHSLANLALASQGHSSSPLANPLGHALGQTPISHRHQVARDSGLGYTREMIDKMASLVKEYNLTQAITFPVEARLMLRNNSLAELQRLLFQVGAHSTLTIVAQQEDLISVDDLRLIRKHFAAQQLLFDLPDELAASLR